MSDRRIAILEVSLQKMVHLMCNKSYLNTDGVEGFDLLHARYDENREVFWFKITHHSLPKVAEGAEIPHVDMLLIEEQWAEWPESDG